MSRWATSMSVGPLTFTKFSAPRRVGLGVGLLYACLWIFIVMLQLCWWMAKVLIVAAALVVAAVVGWFSRDRQ